MFPESYFLENTRRLTQQFLNLDEIFEKDMVYHLSVFYLGEVISDLLIENSISFYFISDRFSSYINYINFVTSRFVQLTIKSNIQYIFHLKAIFFI
jgi:hypothetical protein